MNVMLTHVPAKTAAKGNAKIVVIPGGPGLSSNTLRSLDLLSADFSLYYCDLPGTGDMPYHEGVTFEQIAAELAMKCDELGGDVVLLGHSFGGFFAADAALRSRSVRGLICVATPFSSRTLKEANQNYETKKTSELKQAEEAWEQKPSAVSFARWLANYGELYFEKENVIRGSALLSNDQCSFELFRALQGHAKQAELLLDRLARASIAKLFVGGKSDGLLGVDALEKEATQAHATFRCVKNANHFVMFDRPIETSEIIKNFVITSRRNQA